jgi:hypothetical protein
MFGYVLAGTRSQAHMQGTRRTEQHAAMVTEQ